MTEPDHEALRARGTLMQFAFGPMVSRVVATAVELELPDHIGDAGAEASTLAQACSADESSLTRLLRCLAALEIVQETSHGNFTLTTTGQLLRRDHPASMREIILMWADPAMFDAWRELTTSVQNGRRVFDDVFGTDFFGYLGQNPTLSARFNAAMSQGSANTAHELPQAYEFGRFHTIVDVGGGDGTLLSAVLQEHPAMHGILFDTAEGAKEAEQVLAEAEVASRCQVRSGDFFDSIPSGGDLYMLKSVIHDWNDEAATTILRNCRDSMGPEGRLLILEPVLPDTVESPPGPFGALKYLSDLNMLVNLDGRERTAEDFRKLLRGAGFRLQDIQMVPQLNGFGIIEAVAEEPAAQPPA